MNPGDFAGATAIQRDRTILAAGYPGIDEDWFASLFDTTYTGL